MLNKYSSLENGEVRDDEFDDYGDGPTGDDDPQRRDIKVKQRLSNASDGEARNSEYHFKQKSLHVFDMDAEYGQSIAKNVYQTEEPNQFHDNNPMS